MRKILALVIALVMIAGLLIAAVPAFSPQVEASVYNYDITSVRQTGPNEVTVSLQVLFCSGCNPNVLSSPGCYPFTHGYPPPHYPYYHWCGGYVGGRYVAVRLKDEAGNILGTPQKLVCNPINWPINQLIARDFVFPNVQLSGVARVTAEADVYCSWCGHWYPTPQSLALSPLRVVIDPGHDADSRPAAYKINKGVADKVRTLLEAQGIEVFFTESSHTPATRASYVNSLRPDIFVSLHSNALQGFSRTFTVYATREGLVGHTTANGHVIQERDRFVALPSRKPLCSKGGHEYEVRITYQDNSVVAPVWDVGPWNTTDDYWDPPYERQTWKDLPQGVPQAQAAYQDGYNDGKDQFGRIVANPAGIDLADGTFWDDLGMVDNDWVQVEFLFLPVDWGLPTGAVRGSEVWYYTKNDAPMLATDERDLANRALSGLTEKIGSRSRGLQESEDPWPIILTDVAVCPAVLVQLEFYDHSEQVTYKGKTYQNMRELMVSQTWQEDAANGIYNGIMGYFNYKGLTINAKCPVDLVVTDPDGLRICKDFTEIPGASYAEIEVDGDQGVQIRIPDRKLGDYLIEVVPKPDALPTDTFTLEISLFGVPVIIARNVSISDIPTEPYLVISTEEGIIPPIIGSTIDFDPDVLNLRTRGGVVTAYIELPEGYDVGEIDVSSIRLNGTVPALEWPYEVGDYNDNGIPDLMVKFDRRAVHEVVEVGESVEITITGEVDGIPFMGVDTIRVIGP